jgi:hypothetical protein
MQQSAGVVGDTAGPTRDAGRDDLTQLGESFAIDRLQFEADALLEALEDLCAARSRVVLEGTELELDAHDALRERLVARHRRLLISIAYVHVTTAAAGRGPGDTSDL